MKRLTIIALLGIFFVSGSLFADPPFLPNVRISDDATQVVNQGESCVAVYQNHLYTLCNIAERADIAMIPFTHSGTRGTSWDPDQIFIDNTSGITWHTDPVVGVDDSGHVHMLVQYYTYFIKHYLSRDNGQTWVETTYVSDPNTGGDVDKPWMVVKDNWVYVAWQEFGGSSQGIRFARSSDYGRTWTRMTVDPTTTGIIALNADNIGNVYLAYIGGWWSYGMYFKKSSNHGQSWTSAQYLDDVYYSSGVGDRAPINSLAALPGGILFLTWVDDRNGTWDILGMRSTNGGISWTGPFVVNDITQGGQCKGWATFDPYGGLHVFYYHTPSWPTTTSSLWQVRYRYSADSGATFEPSLRITDTVFMGHYYNGNTDFMGDYHTIVADSNYIYAVWTDGRDGNMNLYFSRALLPQSCLCGDANGDGTVDFLDISYVANYLYGGGPEPQCNLDPTSDGTWDMGDINYIGIYLFLGGPPPCEGVK